VTYDTNTSNVGSKSVWRIASKTKITKKKHYKEKATKSEISRIRAGNNNLSLGH